MQTYSKVTNEELKILLEDILKKLSKHEKILDNLVERDEANQTALKAMERHVYRVEAFIPWLQIKKMLKNNNE